MERESPYLEHRLIYKIALSMGESKCVCVSESHEHGSKPCEEAAVLRIRVQGSPETAAICERCYRKPYVELPLSFWIPFLREK
jgi:hypothetical protein